jgi:5-methylcytosine-specific restriction endonuclease McrA
MPSAILRLCGVVGGGCPVLVTGGLCQKHMQERERRNLAVRGSSYQRGFTRRWYAFKDSVIRRMVALDIAPLCGARLPGAPVTDDSRCATEGLLVEGTEADHIVPYIGPDGTINRNRQFDPLNIQLLCGSCHSTKTVTRDGGFGHRARSA